MSPQAVAQSLAYVNWTVLVALAVGSFAAVVLGRLFSEATRGYLGFVAICAALLGGLAWLSDGVLPPPDAMAIVAAPALDGPRRLALATFSLLALAYAVVVARGGKAPWLGWLGVAAGAAALVLAGVGWAGGAIPGGPVVVQLLMLSAVTGGCLALMILGHWYLVTPHLPERPLVAGTRLLAALVGVQLVLFVAWIATGSGGGGPFGALGGPEAVFVWLRLIVGLVFPFAISLMAVRTARTRSMESATGLLYIAMAAIAASTIVAAGLYFAAGVLV